MEQEDDTGLFDLLENRIRANIDPRTAEGPSLYQPTGQSTIQQHLPSVTQHQQQQQSVSMAQIQIPGGNNPAVVIPVGQNKPRLPKAQWVASLTPDELRTWAVTKAWREQNGKKRKRRYRKKFKKYYRRRYAPRPVVMSAGTVTGMGAYGVQGGIQGSVLGQQYHLGGFYNSGSNGLLTASGYGDYVIKKNSLMGMIDLGTSPPRVMNTNKGEATIINHREYLGDLLSGTGEPTAFKLQTWTLNPGNSSLFPFLGTIAQKFQEYELRGCLFELKTLSSDYAAALSLGSMFMAADYNVLGPAPISKQQLENMEYASSSKPSCSMIMPIECDPRNDVATHLYVASDGDYQGGDKRLFDLCNVYIGTQGIPSEETPVAEIWVTYEVALFKPIIQQQEMPENQLLSAHLIGSGCDTATPFGTTVQWVAGSSDQFIQTDDLSIQFPSVPGMRIMMVAHWVGSVAAVAGSYPEVIPTGTCLELNKIWASSGQFHIDGEIGAEPPTVLSEMILVYTFIQNTKPGEETLGGFSFAPDGNFPTGTVKGDFYFTTISSEVLEGEPNT